MAATQLTEHAREALRTGALPLIRVVVAVGYGADVFEEASSEELAEWQRIATRVREELAVAGVPTVGTDEAGQRGDLNGVLVDVDRGGDSAGGVILQWECSDSLTTRVVAAVADRRFDAPAVRYAGVVRQAMNAAVVEILTAAGFTVIDNPGDLDASSLKVQAAPDAETPLTWEQSVGPARVPNRDKLVRLWMAHRRAEFPASARGRVITGQDMVLLDADIAGCVSFAVAGPLDGWRLGILRECIGRLAVVLPLIDDRYAVEYFTRLRDLAVLAAAIAG